MPVTYTVGSLVERVRRHMANGYPSDESPVSINEIVLYVSQALSFNVVGQVYAGAKVEGILEMPEGYLTTYSMTLTKEEYSQSWYGTLPHPPVALPLGVSVSEAFFGSSANSRGESLLYVRQKRVGLKKHLPLPEGSYFWVVGKKIYVRSHNGESYQGKTLYVVMAKSRVDSVSEELNIPDDAVEAIFTSVTKKLAERFNIPQDVVNDNAAAGNKGS